MPLVLLKPNYPPHVCLICGVGERRKWWVDLQLPIDNYFNPVTAGACYLCNECWDSVAIETSKQAQILEHGQLAWDGVDYVKPTYDNTTELRGYGRSNPDDEGTDSSTTEDDRPTERNDPPPEPDNTDEQAEPLREFGDFFGKRADGD